jgi:hypothetical protein
LNLFQSVNYLTFRKTSNIEKKLERIDRFFFVFELTGQRELDFGHPAKKSSQDSLCMLPKLLFLKQALPHFNLLNC